MSPEAQALGDQPAGVINAIVNANGDVQSGCNGLTKREAFAMAAMQGFCSNPNLTNQAEALLSGWCLKQADALCEALVKEGK